MTITTYPIRSYIQCKPDEDNPLLWKALDNALSYRHPEEHFVRPYRNPDWDGKINLFNNNDKSFRTGLLPRVEKILAENEFEYQIDSRIPEYFPAASYTWNPKIQLREYQEEAVSLIKNKKRGILWAVPRSGKTVIAARLIYELQWKPVVFMCESLDVAYQTQQLMEKCLKGEQVGIVADGKMDIAPVVVATIQSLLSACDIHFDKNEFDKEEARVTNKTPVRKLVENTQLFIGDECHHWASGSYQKVVGKFTRTGAIYGLSGTPWRTDQHDMMMESLSGPILHEIPYQKLIQLGYLVPPTIIFQNLTAMRYPSETPYSTIYKEYITNNQERNGHIIKFAKNAQGIGMSTLILVSKIKHGTILSKEIGCPFAQGKNSSGTRIKLFDELRKKKLLTLVTTLADEGLDIPSLDCEVIAAGGQSSVMALQRLRALTSHPGKKRCIVLDFNDHARHLSNHSRCRREIYQLCGFSIVER